MNQLASVGCISQDQIPDAQNTTGISHQLLHQYQYPAAERTIAAPLPISTNFSNSFIEDRAFTTEDSSIETNQNATNTANSYLGPPPPYEELVTEGDTAREIQSSMTNVLYLIQEAPPAYQVSSTEDIELGMIPNVTNTTYSSSQESLTVYQPLLTE